MSPKIHHNEVAGLHITGSHNVTFEATVHEGGYDSESSLGQGSVGSLDGEQPVDVIVDNSTLITFTDMRVTSSNGTRKFVTIISAIIHFTYFRLLLFTLSGFSPVSSLMRQSLAIRALVSSASRGLSEI